MTPAERVRQAEQFLAELGRGIPVDERVMVGYAKEATVQTDATGKKQNAGWWPKSYKPGGYLDANANCYACISSSIKTPNPKTGELRYWRGDASFGHGLALMVDDIGTGKGSKGKIGLDDICSVLQPTAIVETSGNNYQCWYFLDEPEPSLIRFKAFLTSFVTNVLKNGGDHTIKDAARYGRMPLGYNNKRLTDGSLKYNVAAPGEKPEPFTVRLVASDYSRRYSIEEIAQRFGFNVVMPAKREIVIDPSEFKADTIWLDMAVKILSKAKQGEGSGGDVLMNMSGKYRIACPWGEEHTNGDPFGAYFRGAIPGAEHDFVFGCGHDSCRKARRTWAPFVDKVVMPKIEADLERINDFFCGMNMSQLIDYLKGK